MLRGGTARFNPFMTEIYLLINEVEEGPFAEDEIQQALAWGFMSRDLPAWREGATERLPVGTLMGLPKESKPWVEMYVLKNKLERTPHPEDRAAQAAPETKRKTRVLIIDDGVEFTNIVKLTLELKGQYEVCVENNPLNALATAQRFRPGLVLLDVIMPELDGGEVQRQFKADASVSHIPIIFLTATVRQKDVDEHNGIIDGAAYIAKPVTADGLIKAIEDHL